MSTWSPTVNDSVILKDFSLELSFDNKSSGTWRGDYDYYSRKLGIIPCPSFHAFEIDEGKFSCKLENRVIDLGSWRAMLLACTAIGSTIAELSIHNCQLSTQHFSDLSMSLEKIGRLDVLKLDFIEVIASTPSVAVGTSLKISTPHKKGAVVAAEEDNVPIHITAFTQILSCHCTIDYLSLRGNNFDDDFIFVIQPALCSNLTVLSLNLSMNSLTDIGITRLFQTVRLHNSIRNLSLSRNECAGKCLETLAAMIVGDAASTDDEQSIKGMIKSISEKNKAQKEANKKRKKAGLNDLEEVPPFLTDQRLLKIDKTTSHIVNRNIGIIDLSFNPMSINSLTTFSNKLMDKVSDSVASIACDVSVMLKGTLESVADYESSASLPYPDYIHVIME